jgi:hypothetical protein
VYGYEVQAIVWDLMAGVLFVVCECGGGMMKEKTDVASRKKVGPLDFFADFKPADQSKNDQNVMQFFVGSKHSVWAFYTSINNVGITRGNIR